MNEKKIARVSPRPIGPKKVKKLGFAGNILSFFLVVFSLFFPHLFFSSVAYCSFFCFLLINLCFLFFLICSLFVFLLFSVFANVFLVFFCAVH